MPKKWEDCFIGFGSNLGDRKKNIDRAIRYLRHNKNIKIQKISKIIQTNPVGNKNQPKFLNGALKIKTNLSPQQLLKLLNKIEEKLGRRRGGEKNAARTIDLDILILGNRRINTENLKIPHPRMHRRKFVLVPLYEIAPELRNFNKKCS